MKHFWRILIAVLLTFGTTESYGWQLKDESNTLFKFSGHMQYRGRYYDLDFVRNTNQSEKGSLNRHCYYSDLSLEFMITPNENVTAFFELNKLIFLGQEFRYNTIQTGEEVLPEDVPFTVLDSQGKPISMKLPLRRNTNSAWEMNLRQAWMDVKVPRMKMKLKFGRQPFILGCGLYTNTSIATVFGYQFYTSLDEKKPYFRFGAMKYFEGVRENYNSDLKINDIDDADLFFADLSVPVEKSKLGVFLTHFRDHSLNLNYLHHINLGLTANLALPAGWALKSEFNIQKGKDQIFGGTGIDWQGSMFMANLAAPAVLNKKLKLSAEFGIGSGDDPKTADKFEGYVGVGPFYPYAFAYEYRFIHQTHNSSHFFGTHSRGMAENLAPGLENTTYFKITSTWSLPKNCNFTFTPIWLGRTQERDTFGWEFDNIFNAPVWKNFGYQFIFAYVKPAGYMKRRGFDDGAFAFRNQLEVTF